MEVAQGLVQWQIFMLVMLILLLYYHRGNARTKWRKDGLRNTAWSNMK
jgi:hypothetical protein